MSSGITPKVAERRVVASRKPGQPESASVFKSVLRPSAHELANDTLSSLLLLESRLLLSKSLASSGSTRLSLTPKANDLRALNSLSDTECGDMICNKRNAFDFTSFSRVSFTEEPAIGEVDLDQT